MGYSLTLLAVQCAEPDEALRRLGCVRTGKTCEYAHEAISGYALPGNWFLIVAMGGDEHELFLQPEILGPLSENYPLVTCSIEEHVMYSAAESWSCGSLVWRAEHIGESGPIHLKTSGALPPGFEAMAAEIKEMQDAEGGEHAGVDYYFDIPLMAAKSLMGFKHDEEIPGVNYDNFEIILSSTKSPPPNNQKPWWLFWRQ